MTQSKQLIDRRKDSRAVVESANAHTTVVCDGLARQLRPYLAPAEALPDFSLTIALLVRTLEAKTEEMVEADTRHTTELADDPGFRAARDDLTATLLARITALREALDGVYGSEEMVRYGIKGSTPREPAQLVAFVEKMAERLDADPLPKARFAASLDRQVTAAQLRADVAPLLAALQDVAREHREAEGTLVARNAAIADYEQAFARTTATLGALYRLAGQTELAARIRPSGRRPGRLADPNEPGVEPTPEPAATLEELPA